MWNFLLNAREQTGFEACVLEDIYQKYCGLNTPIKTRKHLSLFLEYCKGYNSIRHFTYTRQKSSFRSYYHKVKQALNHLDRNLDELQEAFLNRFSPSNELTIGVPSLDQSKLIVDTFPVYINRPTEDQAFFTMESTKLMC